MPPGPPLKARGRRELEGGAEKGEGKSRHGCPGGFWKPLVCYNTTVLIETSVVTTQVQIRWLQQLQRPHHRRRRQHQPVCQAADSPCSSLCRRPVKNTRWSQWRRTSNECAPTCSVVRRTARTPSSLSRWVDCCVCSRCSQWRISRGGDRAGSAPSPFGRRTDAVTHSIYFRYVTTVYYGATVVSLSLQTCKTWLALRMFKMIATSGFLTASECTRFVFGRGCLCPGPRWGSLQRSPRSPSWFKGAYFWAPLHFLSCRYTSFIAVLYCKQFWNSFDSVLFQFRFVV